jgi:CubicO group peptidase (beta-lactamase class C family)
MGHITLRHLLTHTAGLNGPSVTLLATGDRWLHRADADLTAKVTALWVAAVGNKLLPVGPIVSIWAEVFCF